MFRFFFIAFLLSQLVITAAANQSEAQNPIAQPDRAVIFLFDKSNSTSQNNFFEIEKKIAFDSWPFEIIKNFKLSAESRPRIAERLTRVFPHSQSDVTSSLKLATERFKEINARANILIVMTDGKLSKNDLFDTELGSISVNTTMLVSIFSNDEKDLKQWLPRADANFIESDPAKFEGKFRAEFDKLVKGLGAKVKTAKEPSPRP
jgi:hypothetical protein